MTKGDDVPSWRSRTASLLLLGVVFLPGLGARAADVKGTLQVVLLEEVKGIDPPQAGTPATRTLAANLFERLYAYGPDHEVLPCLAAAPPEVSEDGLTWTFELRPDVRFVDDPCFPDGKGRAVTASDVVFCLKRLVDVHVDSSARWVFLDRIVGLGEFSERSAKAKADPRRVSYDEASGYPPVKGLEVVDALTLRIRLPRPFPDLAHLLASTFASVYPPEAVARYGDDVGAHPVGTGPYRVEMFLPGRSMILGLNPGYRDGDGVQNDRVVITFHSDPAAGWNAFLRGDADVCEVAPSMASVVLQGSPLALAPAYASKGLKLVTSPYLEVYFLAFNMKDPVLGSPAGEKGLAIRRAICLVDDVRWEIQNLYRGTVIPVAGPLLDEFPESDPTWLAPWSRRPGESLDDVKVAAREVLQEAGLGDGVKGLEMDVLDYPATRQAFERLRAQMADVGLELAPVFVDWPTMRRRIAAGESRMWALSWAADYPSARTFLEVFYAPGNPDPIAGGYSNPAFDELYESSLATADPDERRETYRELQEMIGRDCPWHFRYRRVRFDALHDWVEGYRYDSLVPRWFAACRIDVARRNAYRK